MTISRNRRFIFFAAALAFAVKIVLAARTYGTNDVYAYERFAVWSRYFGADLYAVAAEFNHPPSMIHALRFLRWLSESTGWSFPFLLRLPGILADAGTVWVLCRILGERLARPSVFAAMILIAAAPVQILIAGFHGNTDTLMIFFVILSVWLAGYRDRAAGGGAAFGLALCVKAVPIILVPALFFALPGMRKRVAFFASAAVVVLAAWSPFVIAQPVLVLQHVFGYKSSYGLWGISWIMRAGVNRWPGLAWLDVAFRKSGTVIVMGAIAAVSVWMNRLKPRPSLYAQAGMVFLIFFTGTSGFAVQYLAWLTPWIAGLGAIPVALFVLTGSIFLTVVYNYWALGMPWYLTIAYPWHHLQYFQAACWISILFLTFIAWRQIRGGDFTVNTRWGLGAVCVVAIATIYPAIGQLRRDRVPVSPAYGEDVLFQTEAESYSQLSDALARKGRRAEADAAKKRSAALENRSWEIWKAMQISHPERAPYRSPEDFIQYSLEDFNRGAYADCVTDATAALQYRPDSSAAWNNIALCAGADGDWQRALTAARKTLGFDPDFTSTLKPTLEWALTQQRLYEANRAAKAARQ